MTTDKTPATLATVKHGGCVRLGDGLLPCPFCGNGAEFVPYKNNGLTLKCKSMGCIQLHQRTLRYGIEWLRTSMTEHWNTRALSAQPSPGGQVDGLVESLVQVMNAQYDGLGYLPADVLGVLNMAVEALAARQPVGEPVACRYRHCRKNGQFFPWVYADHIPHHRIEGSEYEHLYAAPPAQAVDLGTVREALQAAEGLATTCASVDGYSREEVAASGRAMRQQFADALAKVDSHAVGK